MSFAASPARATDPTRLQVVTVLLVRHADAGSRSRWEAPDRLRPLTDRGRAQAIRLVSLLGDRFVIDVIRSSPSVRCIETVSPLAATLAADIHVDPVLSEGESPEAAMVLARGATDPSVVVVLCSHGDVIPALLELLEADGVDLGARPECQKGSTWVLEGEHGRFHTAQYLAPPP